MSVNAFDEIYEHVELFGKPALFTNSRIQRNSVPQGWFCYDLRGSDYDPGRPTFIENQVLVNHAGSILAPEQVPFGGSNCRRRVDSLNFLGEEIDLAEFCKEHNLVAPERPKPLLRPAKPEEWERFYALSPQQDADLGAIGHVRMDFGKGGDKFWHTWHPRGDEKLNSPEFKAELNQLIDALRQSGPLQDLGSMQKYCWDNGGKIKGGYQQNYGYIAESEKYLFYLRCNPNRGDYNAYLSCFDKQAQALAMADVVGILSFANGERISYKTGEDYLKALRDELPYRATTGCSFETVTDDPAIRKAVDDLVFDLYGEENPSEVSDYTPKKIMTMEMG